MMCVMMASRTASSIARVRLRAAPLVVTSVLKFTTQAVCDGPCADDAGLVDVLLEYASKLRDTWHGGSALAFELDVAAGKHHDNRDKLHSPGGSQHPRQYKRGLCSRPPVSLDADIDARVDGRGRPKCRTWRVIAAPRRGTRFDTDTCSPS